MHYIIILILLLPFSSMSADPDHIAHADRVIAMGDVHGDIYALKRALRVGGLIDDKDDWIGGTTVLVQTGDQTDRGDFELEIIYLLDKLSSQAEKVGGRVLALLGNHEIMNSELDFRFVTPMGFRKFTKFKGPISSNLNRHLPRLSRGKMGRAIAFFPGGPLTEILAKHNVAAIVGDSVFVHGGILPKWAKYGISKINQETREYLKGERTTLPGGIDSSDSIIWTRKFSLNTGPKECDLLEESLKIMGVKRMVVAHTVHLDGINSECKDKVWRIDVGMSNYYGGVAQVLEIKGDNIRILRQ